MHGLDAIKTIHFGQLATARDPDATAPDRTLIVRPRRLRRGVDATTILVSSVVSGAFFAFAAVAVLV